MHSFNDDLFVYLIEPITLVRSVCLVDQTSAAALTSQPGPVLFFLSPLKTELHIRIPFVY